MAKAYGSAAVMAAKLNTGAPFERWQSAVGDAFPTKETSRTKSCPKGAFLGLCEEGLIKNIPPGSYTRSMDNKAYALAAVRLLRSGQTFPTPAKLWKAVMNGDSKTHNGQADVVLALWTEGLIN